MSRDQIIQWAQECGFGQFLPEHGALPATWVGHNLGLIERFAALVAAHEREECAKVCEGLPVPTKILGAHSDYLEGKRMAISQCAAAIRARGKQPAPAIMTQRAQIPMATRYFRRVEPDDTEGGAA